MNLYLNKKVKNKLNQQDEEAVLKLGRNRINVNIIHRRKKKDES